MRRTVLLALRDGKFALKFPSLLAAHSKTWGQSAVAKDDNLYNGERQGAEHAGLLKAFVMKDHIVNHLERQYQKRQDKRHDQRCHGDFGADAVSQDALAIFFGERLHDGSLVCLRRCAAAQAVVAVLL
ncbi:hypothetical protein [Collinsella bouchesdurhonensis]|uniref:hypothetical protein n=1 Tax=Collinsella bouchesdurhonensis TaxID=1907654 RepID=UPI0012E0329E|nr:hypothetical protein [Collinsella bouchesdurhonensis]